MKLQASAVKQFALDTRLPSPQPRSLRLDGKYPDDARPRARRCMAAQADVMVVAAYGLILPQWVLDAAAPGLPQHPCLAAAALARRGADPPRHRGRRRGTGITIMQMDAGLDTGDMLLGEAADRPDDTTGRCTTAGRARRAGHGRGLTRWRCGGLPASRSRAGRHLCAQDRQGRGADRLARSAAVIERRFRAFNPFPGSTFVVGDPA